MSLRYASLAVVAPRQSRTRWVKFPLGPEHDDSAGANALNERGIKTATAAGRTINDYLAVLDDTAFGVATQVIPKFISPADPAAR